MDKKTNIPPLRVFVKYFLLQLPGQASFVLILLLFHHWVTVPAHLMWVLFGFWVGKDIVLFPLLWRFYDPSHYPDRFQMVGRQGRTLTRLNPDGYVQVQGERWQAAITIGESAIEQDEAIYVQAIDGLKLMVKARTD